MTNMCGTVATLMLLPTIAFAQVRSFKSYSLDLNKSTGLIAKHWLSWSADGQYLGCSIKQSNQLLLKVIDLRTDKEVINLTAESKQPLTTVCKNNLCCFLPSGIVYADLDKIVKYTFSDNSSHSTSLDLKKDQNDNLIFPAFIHPHSKPHSCYLARANSSEIKMVEYDFNKRQFGTEIAWRPNSKVEICHCVISHDGKYLAVAVEEDGYLSSIIHMKIQGADVVHVKTLQIAKKRIGDVRSMCYSSDFNYIYAGASSGHFIAWDVIKELDFQVAVSNSAISALDTLDSKLVVCTTYDESKKGNLHIIDRELLKVTHKIGVDSNYLQNVAYSPKLRQLATVGSDGIIKLWRYEDLK